MKIKPLGYVVLVKPDEYEDKHDLGNGQFLEIVEDKRVKMTITTGTLMDIGPWAWVDRGDGKPQAKIGDKVVYSKFAGKTVIDPDTKEPYLLMNDEDVNAIIEA